MDRALPEPGPQPRRLAYLGSPELAVAPLRALVAAGLEVPLVVSRPDRRRGRGAALSPSPVKAAALELGLPTSDTERTLLDVEADLAVVVAYGRIIQPDLLARMPFVNLHFSLLPRWRGAAPVERALLAGDEVTGVCVMAMEEGLDTGGVYRRAKVPILDGEPLEALRTRLVDVGTGLLLDCLHHGFGPAVPQQGEPVYATKIDPAELRLDWAAPARLLVRTVQLGRAWTTFRGKRLLVHAASVAQEPSAVGTELGPPGTISVVGGSVLIAAGDGAVALEVVQPEGRARQDAMAWRNGAQPRAGERLGA